MTHTHGSRSPRGIFVVPAPTSPERLTRDLFYFRGGGNYRKECQAAADRGFEGFAVN